MGKILGLITIVVVIFSAIIAFRQLACFVILVCMVLVFSQLMNKIGSIATSMIIILSCGILLLYLNSMTPLWGDKYKASLERKRVNQELKNEESKNLNYISVAQNKVKRLLKDPSSASFSGEYVSSSGAVCGNVNAKNSFGGYAGNQRYIYLSRTPYLETNAGGISVLWDKVCN
ncbi:hypothetical protein HZ504_003222 [Salmonella enterica]|nr:hypothetical protein [Salmonella enterica]EHK4563489.1 hypothetical protein [Salmonella enterica]EIF8840989.1 hypothetical protein [Salmonella enterica]